MFTSEAWNNPLEGAYEIEYALSLDSGDSDYLTWTPSSAGNQQKWTISLWFKGKSTSSEDNIYGGGSSGSSYYLIGFHSSNKLNLDFQIHYLQNISNL